MDIRNEIVNTVMLKMQEIIDSKALEILQNALLTGLNQYEITERSTEIVVRDGTAELWWNSNVTYSNSVGAGVTGLTLVSVDIPLPFTISNGMAVASAMWYFSEWAQASLNTKSATHVTVRKFGNENSQNLPVQGVYIYVRGTI